MQNQRIVFLDYLRAIACLMVIVVHACEFYYCLPRLGVIESNIGWVSVIDSLLRPCVPLFVMASSYLLLPLKTDTFSFFKRRFTRILFPFLFFSLLYAVLPVAWGEFGWDTAKEYLNVWLFNFPPNAGHLWFIYMLIGVYLLMPLLSAWLKQVGRKEELCYLGIWAIGTFWHYIRMLSPGGEIYGECAWNEFTAGYYVTGYIGYLLMAHYIRTYIDWSWRRTLAVALPLFVAGYAVTALGFYHNFTPETEPYLFELTWRFCTPNVAAMTFALFLLIKRAFRTEGRCYGAVSSISRMSYGMYLVHIFVLNAVFRLTETHFSTPVCIVVTAVLTYIGSYAIIRLMSLLPGSKYLVG